MKNKPIIGITLDWDDSPHYSIHGPWYALRENYAQVIAKAGAIPITLPYELDLIEQYIELIDGLVVTGGDYDLDPSCYGQELENGTRIIKNNRTDFETRLIRAALDKKIPILAICAGEQLLAAITGGTLLQDIKTTYPNAFEHEQKYLEIPMNKTSHAVKITENSLLHKIVQQSEIMVNSSHHQAVHTVGKDILVSAIAPDNVIEAIEMKNYDFVLGVEWHPEFLATKEDWLIIQAFVTATKE